MHNSYYKEKGKTKLIFSLFLIWFSVLFWTKILSNIQIPKGIYYLIGGRRDPPFSHYLFGKDLTAF